MRMSKIFEGVCSDFTFYTAIKNPKRLAYIITEPVRDKANAGYILDIGWKKMQELASMEIPVNHKTGMPDAKILDLKLKLFQYLDQRENGTLVQRIKQETTNLNVDISPGKSQVPTNSEEEVRGLIHQLRQNLAQIPIPPEPKLVLPTEMSHRDAGKKELGKEEDISHHPV